MKKINFVNGKTIDGASTFNKMQDNVEDVFNGKESMGSIVVEDIICKNLFDKNNKNYILNNTYIDKTNKKIASASGGKTLYIPCKANTTYTVSKIASARFAVASGNDLIVGASLTTPVQNNTATSITYTTGNDSYLLVFYFLSSQDTSITEKQILDSIQIEYGDRATQYVEHKEFNNKQIYSADEKVICTYFGKPLYRKTFIGTSFPSGTTVSSVELISNVDTLVNYYGTVKSSDGVRWAIPYFDVTNNYLGRILHLSNNKIRLDVDKVQTYNEYKITLEYTKTTD